MIGEILGKALVVVKGDTSHARAEIAKLSAEEQKAARARVKAQEESDAALQRGQQKFMLYAAGAAAGWAVISSSVKKYEEHLVSLGAKGESELKKLRDTTGGLTKAQNELQFAIARLALEAEPAAKALGEMAMELANIVNGIGSVVRAAGDIPIVGGLLGDALGVAMKFGGPVNQGLALGSWVTSGVRSVVGNIRATGTVKANYSGIDAPSDIDQVFAQQDARASWSQLTGKTSGSQSLLGEEGKQAIQYIDQEAGRLFNRALMGKAERFIRGVGRGLGVVDSLTVEGRGGGAKQQGVYADAWRIISGDIAATSGAARGGYVDEYSDASLAQLAGESAKGADFGQFGEYEDIFKDRSAEGKREKDAMEKMVGPIQQFDEYAIGFSLVQNAATSAFAAIVTGSDSAGAAMKKVVAQGIMALGKDMLVRSLQEGAWAIADLAKGNLAGAAIHGKAAAMFLAGSVAAGTVAAGLGVGGGGAGGSYASAGGIGGRGGGAGGDRGGSNVTVVMGDGFADNSPRYVGRRTRRAMDLASRYAPNNGGQAG